MMTKIFSIIHTSFLLLTISLIVTLQAIPTVNSLSLATAATAATNTVSNVKDFSGTASSLFNNMRTPAALIGGAIVPLGILSAPKLEEDESPKIQLLKKANFLLAVASLLSEILAITYSTVAINKLAEVKYAHTSGVSELIVKNFELAWIGTNVHFLFGLFGFGLLVGSKAFFMYGAKVGRIAQCWSIAAFLQCTSIVNKGIALGSNTNVDEVGFQFAKNLFFLTLRYMTIVISELKRGPLPILVIGFTIYSLFLIGKLVFDSLSPIKDKVE
jgi:hypothetical protein